MYAMSVCGENVEFLVDSGATLCYALTLPEIPANIRRYTHSVSAAGHVQRENFAVPLSCIYGHGQKLKHSFLWLDSCPVNLLNV